MDLLVLGGTVFLGRHVVDAALARGDRVTVFHRGRHAAHRPGNVEEVLGDRDGGLDVLRGRRWDACVDTSGYVPRIVGQSVEMLAEAVGRYVFVSTGNVYADLSKVPLAEDDPLHELPGPEVEDIAEAYGPLKVGCERVVTDGFGDRSVLARAGLIVGPWDRTDRLTYWVRRFTQPGPVLVPDAPDQPVQFVDVRDLAAWLVAVAQSGASGPMNANGALGMTTLGALFADCRRIGGDVAEAVPVTEQVLLGDGIQPWSDLPLWLPPAIGASGMMSMDVTRAEAAGLRSRPVAETLADTLAWDQANPDCPRGLDTGTGIPAAGLDPAREIDLISRLTTC